MRFAAFLIMGTCLIATGTAWAGADVAAPSACRSIKTTPFSAFQPLSIRNGGTTKARLKVEIADTPAEQQQGLMCRTSLAADKGMLFQFPDAREHSFWMRNTLIPLDIVYIRPDGRILSIQKNARPLDETPLPSYGRVSAVLEIEAGLADKLGLAPGDVVVHPFFQTN